MTADRSTDDKAHLAAAQARAVREQLRLGRLLPLGGPADGAWIAERAAAQLLRPAAAGIAGVRVDGLRLALAAPDEAADPVVPAPPSALPPGPLRIEVELAVTADEPLPSTAARVRAALSTAAAGRIGLVVAEVDVRITELLDAPPSRPAPEPAPPAELPPTEDPITAAVRAVPGVTAVRALREARLPAPHVRLELTVSPDHRTLDTTQAARTAARAAAPPEERPTVAVVVTGAD
ncbi:nucleopolyhedrovirus P10 family protein [Streptomyces sp. Da 82-17]|uniref:nucleopolyhedrovirus P10 family protein n=1 Tax=Streptomyces sp. Da 82-17 TaxID=3377116 RepID=UPI0038D486E4